MRTCSISQVSLTTPYARCIYLGFASQTIDKACFCPSVLMDALEFLWERLSV